MVWLPLLILGESYPESDIAQGGMYPPGLAGAADII